MENKELITKGVISINEDRIESSEGYMIAVVYPSGKIMKANASLICEAFNVFNETNLTPLEMKERIEELENSNRNVLDKFISEIKREFPDQNWTYLSFIKDRVLSNKQECGKCEMLGDSAPCDECYRKTH